MGLLRLEMLFTITIIVLSLAHSCQNGQLRETPKRECSIKEQTVVKEQSIRAAKKPSEVTFSISAKGIGPFAVGSAFPVDHIQTGELSKTYRATFYSDAQPLEGFELSQPPVFVSLDRGPFSTWGAEHPGETVPDEIKAKAIELVKAGRLRISMIVATSPLVATVKGVHPGTSYETFHSFYPGAHVTHFPTLWEEPTCVAKADGLWFFFNVCASNEDESPPKNAKVNRIVSRHE